MKHLLSALMFVSCVQIVSSQNLWQPLDAMYCGDITAMTITQDGTIFAGTQTGIYRSIDNGNHWTATNAVQKNSKTLCLLESNGIVFAGNEDGIFPSTYSVYIAVVPGGDIYSGSGFIGAYKSTDHGLTWSMIATGLKANLSAMIVTTHGVGIAINTGEELYRSNDNGASWKKIAYGCYT